jgi:hypothetical protein
MPPACTRGARPRALCGCEDPVPTSLDEGEIIREKLQLICSTCDIRDRNAPWGTRDLNEQANDNPHAHVSRSPSIIKRTLSGQSASKPAER